MNDILVVGGGPVGLSAAIMAAQAGFSVSILEQREGCIDKACGEGLMPAAVEQLQQMGVQIQQSYAFHG